MIDTSDTLQSPFQPDTPVGIVLYLGAGRAVDLPEWQATDAKQIVLVEPNPAAFSGLQNHANQDARITVLQLAVSNKTGQAPLHVMTVPDFSSLCRASGISLLFPGLRQVSTPEVETVSVADLISQITIPAALPNVLILDVPGMEADILDQMDEGDYLGLFEHVVLRGAAAQAYEGARAVAPLIAQLTAKGYNLEFSDESDPDFLSCRLRRDPITLQLAAAKRAAELTAATHENALADLQAQRVAEKANAENIAQAAEAANTAHENALADLQRQLQAQRDAEKANAESIAQATEATSIAHENALADLQLQLQAQQDAEKANAENIAQAAEATRAAHENTVADLQAQRDAEKANAENIAQAAEAASAAHENALADLLAQRDAEKANAENIAQAAEAARAAHENALADLLAQRDAEKANAENIAQAAEAASAAHENALADLLAQRDAEKANAENIAQAAEAARAAHENALADLLAQRTATLAAEADLNKQRDATLAAEADLNKQRNATHAAEADLNKQRDATVAVEAELNKQRDTTAAANQKADSAEQNLALSLRQMSLFQSDLKDLQERYMALVDERGQQEELLQQLTQRLSQAVQYLREIDTTALPDPEYTSNTPRISKPKTTKPKVKPAPRRKSASKPKTTKARSTSS